MGQLTSAVSDEQLISHFKEVIAPYCVKRQLPLTALSTTSQPIINNELQIQTLEKSLVDIVPTINDIKTVSTENIEKSNNHRRWEIKTKTKVWLLQ
jgi:glutamate 5-kinase